MPNTNVGFRLEDDNGTIIFSSYDADNQDLSGVGRKPGFYQAICSLPGHFLNNASYALTVEAGIPHQRLCVRIERALTFEVRVSPNGSGPAGRMGARRSGLLDPTLQWELISEYAETHAI